LHLKTILANNALIVFLPVRNRTLPMENHRMSFSNRYTRQRLANGWINSGLIIFYFGFHLGFIRIMPQFLPLKSHILIVVVFLDFFRYFFL